MPPFTLPVHHPHKDHHLLPSKTAGFKFIHLSITHMKLFSTSLAFALSAMLISPRLKAQSITPFTTCPATTLAVARGGGNVYSNEGVSFYNINPSTGVGTLIPGGPLKNPQFPVLNFDMNAVGVNSNDGFLYGINPGLTPRFYRMGSNYGIQQLGVLAAPSVNFPLFSFVNSAGGGFDNTGNYYFTALSAFISVNPPSLTPFEFYIGKLANTASLPAGTGNLTPTYTKLNFGNALCGEFLQTLQAASTPDNAENTGLRDLTYNPTDGQLYTYVTFEYPVNSGIFKGQLLRANPATGLVTCYPSSVLGFANASNEVAGVAVTFTGDLLILFTGGATYKAVSPSAGVYTGAITLLNSTSVPGPLRGDLATCGGATAGPTPVKFENFTATENRCNITYKWTIAQEVNVNHYELEIQNGQGLFTKSGNNIAAISSASEHTYSQQVPVDAKTMIARVKSVDNDGKITYSPILQTLTSCSGNPRVVILNSMSLENTLTARWSNISVNGRYNVNIYNSIGSLVSSQQVTVNAGTTNTTIDLRKLPAGTYIFVAQNNAGEKYNVSFVKK